MRNLLSFWQGKQPPDVRPALLRGGPIAVPAVLLNILRARDEELYPKLVSRLIGPFIPLCHCYVEKKRGGIACQVLGDHCRQTQQSRLELGLCFCDWKEACKRAATPCA